MSTQLPPIPAKRYFTIGEVADLCGVKPHVLRYWEQEFTQLRPVKRRGNRRYYQHHEVLMIRRIRDLLYDQGFTISGARNRLQELTHADKGLRGASLPGPDDEQALHGEPGAQSVEGDGPHAVPLDPARLRKELEEIRALLF
ncbi:MerR family transcriptional regulator [Alicycliphilus denitrificans]|uniref:Transcriptional regulator, MerR family n=2 Tax=Alicycliphilus denitrificans TaxID=179636 RepID=F4G427_ALIDK|nr:MerR family transcriptional regulator [Alicycliphilus denitrificans]AEB85171.1 transcriptional regulator, MerR family [Alicycliphilus denitrificans K601]QKD43977.1 MerR family transcriptional regulator [Alicycliphilus denitrificans]